MAASDDFKQALKAGNFQQALQVALGEAVELEITTWVRVANPYSPQQEVPKTVLPGYRMRTRINLVEGDIDTEVGSNFVGTGPYADLKEFHTHQILESRDIIQQNLETLEQMFTLMAETLTQLSKNQSLSADQNQPDPRLALPSQSGEETLSFE